MSTWWDDFLTLLFKRGLLLKEQLAEVIGRYLRVVKQVTIHASSFLVILLIALVVLAASNVQLAWIYPTLLLLMAGALIVMIVVALPLLVLSEVTYGLLPQVLRDGVLTWLRRGGAVLFCGLFTAVFVSFFRLWQSPGKMLFALLILATLGVGAAIGWLKLPNALRQSVATKLVVLLVVVAIAARFPLVAELGNWITAKGQAAVFGVTRPTPERWQPASVDELRFVDEGTGDFLVWYYRDENSNYELYKSKGYHRLGTPLKLAETEAEFTAIRRWQLASGLDREMAHRAEVKEAARRQEDERIATAKRADEERVEAERRAADLTRKQEEERVAAAKRADERAREAERVRLASYVVALPNARVNYIVFFVDSLRKSSSEVTSNVVNRLVSRKDISAAGDVFADAFISQQGFDDFVAGKGAADLVAMRLGDAADRLLLIRGSDAQSGPSSSVAGLRSYSMLMTVSLIDARDGKKVREFAISDVTGAGLNEVAARAAFIERFAEALAARDELLEGLR